MHQRASYGFLGALQELKEGNTMKLKKIIKVFGLPAFLVVCSIISKQETFSLTCILGALGVFSYEFSFITD